MNLLNFPQTTAAAPSDITPRFPKFKAPPTALERQINKLFEAIPTYNFRTVPVSSSQAKEVKFYLEDLFKKYPDLKEALSAKNLQFIKKDGFTFVVTPKDEKGVATIAINLNDVDAGSEVLYSNGVIIKIKNDTVAELSGRSIQLAGETPGEFKNDPRVKVDLEKLVPGVKLPSAFDLILNQPPQGTNKN